MKANSQLIEGSPAWPGGILYNRFLIGDMWHERTFRLELIVVILAVLYGCASVDFDYPRVESTAVVDTDNSYLGCYCPAAR